MSEISLLEKVASLCKRRGFVFPNSGIYGGLAGFYDYGPLGVELKNNIKRVWWREMVDRRDDVVGIDGAIITHPKVWEASGHIEGFTDPLVDCKRCHKRFRADHLVGDLDIRETGAVGKELLEKLSQLLKGKKCPECGGELTKPRRFNLLVEAGLGVIEGEKQKVYLRGEACQTIYLNYQNVLDSTSLKIPFGIAQIGKAFRNEITPKNFLYRQREFEQWDLQWFVNPKEMEKWYEYWKEERMRWYRGLVNHEDKIRFRQHEFSGKDFTYKDPRTKEEFLPWIVETSGGVDRTFLFLLLDAYSEDKGRVVLKLKPELAPYKVAVFPLVANKEKLVKKARSVLRDVETPQRDVSTVASRMGRPW